MTNWIKSLARRVLGKELASLRLALDHFTYENQKLESYTSSLERQLSETKSALSDRPHITEYKITEEVYKKHIVDKLPPPVVNQTVTPQHTGYLLGIQATLEVIRRIVV